MNENPVFTSLCENDKETVRSFINRSDDRETRKWILSKMIDLVAREPKFAKVDVRSEVAHQPFLPNWRSERHKRLFPLHVLLISYGKPDTEAEADLTLQLLILTFAHMGNLRKATKVDLGTVWAPKTGWGPLEIALICNCESRLIDWLLIKKKESVRKGMRSGDVTTSILAAVLGHYVEYAKILLGLDTSALTKEVCIRETRSDSSHRSILELLLTMPENDLDMDLLKHFFDTVPAALTCFDRKRKFSDTPRRTDTLLTCLRDHQKEVFQMKSLSWSFDGFRRLMSGLAENSFIHTLNLRVPDDLIWNETIQIGLMHMFQQMKSLVHLEMDLEDDSWWNNQFTFDALAEAFPECNVRSVVFQGPMRFTNERSNLSGLCGSAALEKVLNNIHHLGFIVDGEFEDGLEFLDLIGKAAKFSPRLTRIYVLVRHRNFWMRKKLVMPRILSSPPASVNVLDEDVDMDVSGYDLRPKLLDSLAAAFDKHGACIHKLSLSLSDTDRSRHPKKLSGATKLSARSHTVKLQLQHFRAVRDITTVIGSTQNLVELSFSSFPNIFCEMSDAAKGEVVVAIIIAVEYGRVTKLTCPMVLVRETSRTSPGCLKKLESLKLIRCCQRSYCKGNRTWGRSAGPANQLGDDLIHLMERSHTLKWLETEVDLTEDRASILRHRIVYNHVFAHQVEDITNATIPTLCSVLIRINDTSTANLYRLTRKDDKEQEDRHHDSVRVSVAFEVLLRSCGMIASWCKANHWRWKEKHELDFALSFMFDFEPSRDSKRPRFDLD